jgi:hypothetical protein
MIGIVSHPVIPAKAGIQFSGGDSLDARLRGHDDFL